MGLRKSSISVFHIYSIIKIHNSKLTVVFLFLNFLNFQIFIDFLPFKNSGLTINLFLDPSFNIQQLLFYHFRLLFGLNFWSQLLSQLSEKFLWANFWTKLSEQTLHQIFGLNFRTKLCRNHVVGENSVRNQTFKRKNWFE